jgi:glycosyltransferase involved in cell wall biosynthesis
VLLVSVQGLRLVIVPSDPIASYEEKGIGSWLEGYYNPQKLFREVFVLSPLEQGERFAYGIMIRGVKEKDFLHTLKEIQPDVVRAYGAYWPADLACRYRLPNVPVIVSVHDTNPSRLHKSVRYADLVICISRAVQNRVVALGVNPERLRLLPNRVDTSLFHPVEDKDGLQSIARCFSPGKHILHVGRKSHEKNLDTLISSLKFLPANYSSIFVGLGDRTPFLSLAKDEGVSERCFWVDSVKNEELPGWYSWCDCMCTPSRWEGFGIVFIEAAACGAAIVTSDIAPMNEYLENNRSACLLKDYEDPKALAEAILKVCEDSDYHRLISAGAVMAAQPFERSIVDKKEASIYREALGLEPLSLSISDKLNLAYWKASRRMIVLSRVILTQGTDEHRGSGG